MRLNSVFAILIMLSTSISAQTQTARFQRVVEGPKCAKLKKTLNISDSDFRFQRVEVIGGNKVTLTPRDGSPPIIINCHNPDSNSRTSGEPVTAVMQGVAMLGTLGMSVSSIRTRTIRDPNELPSRTAIVAPLGLVRIKDEESLKEITVRCSVNGTVGLEMSGPKPQRSYTNLYQANSETGNNPSVNGASGEDCRPITFTVNMETQSVEKSFGETAPAADLGGGGGVAR